MDIIEKRLETLHVEKSKAHEKIYSRLNELEKYQAVSLEQYRNLMAAMDRQDETLEKLEFKLNELIAKPSKRWDGIIASAISAIIGGVIAYILVQLGLKG